jgi:hypothetical protein
MIGQPVRDNVWRALGRSTFENPAALHLGEHIDSRHQGRAVRRGVIDQEMNAHGSARDDFTRLERFHPIVTLELEQLKSVVEAHSTL